MYQVISIAITKTDILSHSELGFIMIDDRLPGLK